MPFGFDVKHDELTKMMHAALAPRIGREFDRFLFATIGEGRHGNSLSVISALAQSDVDPWLEAVG